MGTNYNMVTKYVITMTHHTGLGEASALFYYAGQAGGYMEKRVPLFDYRKTKAKRYLWEHEAIRDMTILKAMTSDSDIYEIVAIRCRA